MRRLGLLLLALSSTLLADTPAEQFRAAYAQWTAHRPDGMTWDDDSAIAVNALNSMWSSAAQVAVQFLAAHPTARAEDLSSELSSLLPETDPKFGPPLAARTLEVQPGLYVVAFNSDPAGTVFAIRRTQNNAELRWAISLTGAQPNDPKHLLASWHASRAGNACVTRYHYASGICGPMASVGLESLPPNSSGQARFFITATYSKDMGATLDKQISVWTMNDTAPTLEWINLYAEGGEEEIIPNGAQYKDGTLLIAEKHEFETFPSCGSCSGRQMIRRLRITPDAVKEEGLSSAHPELDLLDHLFQKIAEDQSADDLASSQVTVFLQPKISAAKERSRKIDPHFFSVGMLTGFSIHPDGSRKLVCFQSDELGPLNFTLEPKANGYRVTRVTAQPEPCDATP